MIIKIKYNEYKNKLCFIKDIIKWRNENFNYRINVFIIK